MAAHFMCKVYRKAGQGLVTGTPPPQLAGWSYGGGFLAAQLGPAFEHAAQLLRVVGAGG